MRILIVKTSSLGDIIHAYPALAYLRRRFPKAQIDWVVEDRCRELVESHPDVDRTIAIDSKSLKMRFPRDVTYDWVFDLQGNIKSGVITFQARSKNKVGFGRKTIPEWPNLFTTHQRFNPPAGQNIRDDYLFLVQSPFHTPEPFEMPPVKLKSSDALHTDAQVMVCPGSAWPSKQLSTDTLIDFCQRLDKRFLFVWGSQKERLIAQTLKEHLPGSQIAPKLTLPA
jgi:heptosyltransferase I